MIKYLALFAILFVLFLVPTPIYRSYNDPLYKTSTGHWTAGCPLALRIMYGGTGRPQVRYGFCLKAFANKIAHIYEGSYEVGKSYGPVKSMKEAVKIVKNTKGVYELLQRYEAGVEPVMYELDSKTWKVVVYEFKYWGITYLTNYRVNAETGEITEDRIENSTSVY